jgi:ABC-2 type transport system permease protein
VSGEHWRAFVGAARYEFRMQVRRPAMWIVLAMLALLTASLWGNPWNDTSWFLGRGALLVEWSVRLNWFLPVGVGVLLADRLPRDRREKVDELFATLPASGGGRLLGKYVGSTLAVALPVFALYAVWVGRLVALEGEAGFVLRALAAFAAVNLPAVLFVGAFAIACPAVLRVPLFQFLFVGYWFWGNLLHPEVYEIPTISATPLTPAGGYAAAGFFGRGIGFGWTNDATAGEAVLSLGLLATLAAAALFAAHRYLVWQQDRQ